MIEAGDRTGIRRPLEAHPVHNVPPVGDPYVLGRPHSGTTLLGHVPDIHDDRESLHHAVRARLRFLENRVRRCGKRGYVFKLLSYQMLEVQHIRDPLAFSSA